MTARNPTESGARDRVCAAAFSGMLSAVSQPVFWKDAGGVYLGCNALFAEIVDLGCPEDIVGKTDYDLPWSTQHADAHRKADRRVMETDQPLTCVTEPLLAADGSVLWVETTRVPLHDGDGRVCGVLGLFDDVTRREEARRALAESEHRFRSLFGAMSEGVCLHEIICDASGRPADYVILDVNPAYESIVGVRRADVVGRKASEFYGTGQPPYLDIYARVAETGEPCSFETYFAPMEKHFSVSVYSPRRGQFATTFADVTERKRIDEQVRASEAKFRLLAENSTDMISSHSTSGTYVYVSPSCTRLIGYKPDELIGRDAYEFVHPDDIDLVGASHQTILGSDASPVVTYRIRRKDGSYVWVESNSRSVRDEQGNLVELQVSTRDITERKAAEEHIRKVNRTLRVLSDSNQALIRATSEPELLQDICDIVAGVGGYRMVWIGFAENDEEKTVRPVAHSGFEDGYLSKVTIQWSDSKYGGGPVGTAIRTGMPAFCRDVLTDPAFAPWRDEASERGYTSAIAVPLLSGARAMGVLALYSDRDDEFEDEEARLLVELASDISYGIAALRTRDEHRRAEDGLRESQRSLVTLMSNLPGMAYRCLNDENWTMSFVSGGCLDLTGYPPEALVGNATVAYGDLIHPDDRSMVWDGVQKALEDQRSFVLTYRIAHASGEQKWVWEQGRGVYSGGGDLLALEGLMLDVTEQVETEEALRKSEERYRKLYESMMDGFALTDLEGNVLETNQSCRDIVGYSEEEFRHLSHLDVTPEKWHAKEKAIIENELLPRGYTEIYEKEYRRKDGSLVPVELRAYLLRDDEDRPKGIWAIVRDITERKRSEEDKRLFYRETIKSVTDGKLEIASPDELDGYVQSSGISLGFDTALDLTASRRHIESYCRSSGVKEDSIGLFMTAVGEAMTNALKHGGAGRVFSGSNNGELWVGVTDTGPGIATLTLPGATLRRGYSTKASMGMGYSIMLEVADRVMLSTGPDGTTVILLKNLAGARPLISLDDLRDTWDSIR